MNSVTPEESTNSTEHFFWPLGILGKSVFIVNVLFGLPAHSYILWLVVTGTGSGVASEFFNLNLSVCEIFYCLNCLLTLLSFVCQSLIGITQFLIGLGIAGRSLFQSLICVERYLAMVHPVIFLKYKPLRYRVICSVIVWLAGFVSGGFSIMTWLFSLYKLYFSFFLSQFILFLSIQLFCCLAVFGYICFTLSGLVQPLLFLHRVGKLPSMK